LLLQQLLQHLQLLLLLPLLLQPQMGSCCSQQLPGGCCANHS
jgi:hypothetical protein